MTEERRVYGNERGCDVIFLAGRDETWRLPAHSAVLRKAENPVFSAMLSEHFVPSDQPPPHIIKVPDCDGRALDNLLRFLYKEEPSIQSIETALITLYAGHKYLCPGLAILCVKYLGEHISATNVLTILQYVRILCGDYQNLENLCLEEKIEEAKGGKRSKPKVHRSESANLSTIELDCAHLLFKCLNFVDGEGALILTSEDLENLDLETVNIILSRDTLDICDEQFAFKAILRWGDKECKRQQLPLTPSSMRKVLGDSFFLPRYLVMSVASFESGPGASGLFSEHELAALRRILSSPSLLEKERKSLPMEILPFLSTLSAPRQPHRPAPKGAKKTNFNLWASFKKRRMCGCNKRMPKKSPPSSPLYSQGPRRGSNSSEPRQARCQTVVEQVVVCFACLFD